MIDLLPRDLLGILYTLRSCSILLLETLFLFRLLQHALTSSLAFANSRLLLDYSIFEEPKVNGRSTGKINKHARELRITDNEVENAKKLVKGVSQSRSLFSWLKGGSVS